MNRAAVLAWVNDSMAVRFDRSQETRNAGTTRRGRGRDNDIIKHSYPAVVER